MLSLRVWDKEVNWLKIFCIKYSKSTSKISNNDDNNDNDNNNNYNNNDNNIRVKW